MERIYSDSVGSRILALGNEAIVRGALESGVDVASTYPGTPSSEIGDILFRIADDMGIYFEYSVNEKVALELGIGAAISGLRAMTFMKHVGMNVASDAFVSLAYVGVRGGHVIISADDPGSHSSQNEQDNRWYARLANVPMLEPSSPSEAKEMVVYAFELSEKLELPVLLRTTTRVSHTRAPVMLGEIKRGKGKSHFESDPKRFMLVPEIALKNHKILIGKMKAALEESERSRFNFIENEKSDLRLGVVTSGVSYGYTVDVLKKLDLKARILKLGFTNPIPRKMCADFLKDLENVIVIEELDPYLEEAMKSIAGEFKIQVNIFGKETGHFPMVNEYNPDIIGEGIARVVRENTQDMNIKEVENPTVPLEQIHLPSRPPMLCPGCPHRATAYAAKKAAKEDTIYPMDIGCYTLVFEHPLRTADVVLCMGSSIGTACGFSRATDQDVIAFMGDSTFFHAGIPGLINALHQGHNFVLAILDNRTTAMTGFQPHPGVKVGTKGTPKPAVDILDLVKGCGIDSMELVDPNDLKRTIAAFSNAISYDGLSVIIARHACALLETKVKRRSGDMIIPFDVDRETCIKCYTCTKEFGCPASRNEQDDYPEISPELCMGCGVCAQVCPTGSIKPVSEQGGDQ